MVYTRRALLGELNMENEETNSRNDGEISQSSVTTGSSLRPPTNTQKIKFEKHRRKALHFEIFV